MSFFVIGVDRDELCQRLERSAGSVTGGERLTSDSDGRLAEQAPQGLLLDVEPGIEDRGGRDGQARTQVASVQGEHVACFGIIGAAEDALGPVPEGLDVRRCVQAHVFWT